MKDIYDIIPLTSYATIIIEEGHASIIVDGIIVSFTVHQYSNDMVKVMLDDDYPEIRKILSEYGGNFIDDSDEMVDSPFTEYINEIYSLSGSTDWGTWKGHIDGVEINENDYKDSFELYDKGE